MMMSEHVHHAQVRKENFSNEISDGISSSSIVLYRTACQDVTERSCYGLKFHVGRVISSGSRGR
jgi:hypothetical protein